MSPTAVNTAGTIDVALRDGSSVRVRPVVPSDRDAISAFFESMSPESAYFRGCGILNPDKLADWAADVDGHDRYGVLVTAGMSEQIVGHAEYVRVSVSEAEVAFEVADQMQGQGIGTLLLAQLAVVAVANNIAEFTADVMPSNHNMTDLFRQSGFRIRSQVTDGLTTVIFETALSPSTVARFDGRDRHAARAALKCFLEPRSVAVVGASGHPENLGGQVISNLIASGYTGDLYPVNLHRRNVGGIPAVRTIADLPNPVDLAVVVVPTDQVLDVALQCGEAGARAMVVISAGFVDPDTAEGESPSDLLTICRSTGMRLIGPNALGLLNTDPRAALNASLIRAMPDRGTVGLMSQSGGVGVALVAAASRLGIGLSSFVSVGDKADISGNDLLAYWDEDPSTKVILLYLESFGNPRRFARFAQHVSAHKPILAVKSGTTPVGAHGIEGSTTAQLLAASDVGIGALLGQAGVIRTDSTSELLEAAALLSQQPAPAGNRVVVLSNSGGPARLCAEACEAAGLELVGMPASVLPRELEGLATSGANPVILHAAASAKDYRAALGALAESTVCDAVITLFIPSVSATAGQVAKTVDDLVAEHPRLCFATVLMDRHLPLLRSDALPHAVRYMFPEEAARALGHAASWSLWRASRSAAVAGPDGTSPEQGRSVIARALTAGPGWLGEVDVRQLLDCYGLSSNGPPDGGPDAQQLMAGVVQDAAFGPLVVCGRPAAAVAVRLLPVRHQDATEMVRTLQTSIWTGTHTSELANPAGLIDVLMRLGAMAEAHPEIAAVDLDPLTVGRAGMTIGDVRIFLAKPPVAPTPGALR